MRPTKKRMVSTIGLLGERRNILRVKKSAWKKETAKCAEFWTLENSLLRMIGLIGLLLKSQHAMKKVSCGASAAIV